MAPKPDDLDQSKEARTPEVGDDAALGAVMIMRVVDMKLRFPQEKIADIADMVGCSRHLISRALSTPMAKARLESAYDVRPLVQERLKSQALNAFELLSTVQIRCLEQLENRDLPPDSALLAAATRASLETLKGVGILKDHSIEETKQLDATGVAALLDKADSLQAQLETNLKEKLEVEALAVETVTEDAQK